MWRLLICISIFIFSCKKSNKVEPVDDTLELNQIVTWDKNIKPLFSSRCSPCHTAGGDRTNKYDDYNTSKTLITGIIGRIKKQSSEPLFMPKNGTKLNQKEMALVNAWIDQGLLEK
jgi:uncharacterized membrane protein